MPYLTARFIDDPYNSALIDAVVALGYERTYVSFLGSAPAGAAAGL